MRQKLCRHVKLSEFKTKYLIEHYKWLAPALFPHPSHVDLPGTPERLCDSVGYRAFQSCVSAYM